MSCIKSIALTDPLIDCVTPDNLISDVCTILDVDLRTVKIHDLDFVAQYKLVFKRKEKFHAFVSWFDCKFEACKPVVNLSTSPWTKPTHWKHTVL